MRAEGGVPDAQVIGDTEGAVAWVRAQPWLNGKVGVFGTCSGGRQTFLYACHTNNINAAWEIVPARVPAAAALGTAVGHASERAAEQRRASLTQVQARTLESTDPVVTEVPGAYSSQVKVGWTDPAGWPHEGSMSMPAGTRAGTPVTI